MEKENVKMVKSWMGEFLTENENGIYKIKMNRRKYKHDGILDWTEIF